MMQSFGKVVAVDPVMGIIVLDVVLKVSVVRDGYQAIN